MRISGLPTLFVCLSVACPAYADVIHVDADANGAEDGRSWATAHTTLSAALARARDGDSVWIAEGVYHPDTTDPGVSFEVPSGVEVIGGFRGTESRASEADPARHLVVLSGDLAEDDAAFPDGITYHPSDIVGVNSRHVVRVADADAVRIVGVVVTAGHAVELDGSGTHGAGILIDDADVELEQIHVVGNRAGLDGFGDGAGVYCESAGGREVRVRDSSFLANAAARRGGGIAVFGCDVDLSETDFFGNAAGTVEDPTLCARPLRGGGAVHVAGATAPQVSVRDSRFEDNEAACRGGAMSVRGARVEVDRSWFQRNRAFAPDAADGVGLGGAAHLVDATAAFRETVGLANVASGSGGVFYVEASWVGVVNGTFLENQAVFGPMVRVDGEGEATVEVSNSILQGHGPTPASVPERMGAELAVRVRASLVDRAFAFLDLESSVVGHPTFLDPSDRADEMESVRLSPASLGLGLADAAYVTSDVDYGGRARVRGTQIDVGATQAGVRCAPPGTARLFAGVRARGEASGVSWEDAVSLADALAFVDSCPGVSVGSIWIQGGVHHPDRGEWVERGDVDATFVLPSYVVVRGGFVGDESTVAERDLGGRATTLSGDIGDDDMTDALGLVRTVRGENSRHVVYARSTESVLERVAITGGDAVGSRGGGLWIDGSDGLVQEVVVAGNFAEVGAGVAIQGDLGPQLRRTMIAGNVAREHGGGVSVDSAPARFDNVVISGNVATRGAGGWLARTDATLDFVDVTGNRALLGAGGLILADGAQPRVTGSILFGNADGGRDAMSANLTISGASSAMWLGTSIVQGTDGGFGSGMQDMGENLDAHPLFVDVLDPALAPSIGGDFRLRVGSPARDRGPRVTDIEMTDMSRAPRAVDGDGDGFARPDIGAFEASAILPPPDVVAVGSAIDVLIGPPAEAEAPTPLGMMDGGGCSVSASRSPWPGVAFVALAVGWIFRRRRLA